MTRKKSSPMFKHPILESLSKSSLELMVGYHFFVISVLAVYAYGLLDKPVATLALIFFAGLVFWTLAEYALHRWFFHFISESPWAEKFHFVVHGHHHEHPRDDEHLFMPPLPAALLLTLFLGIFYLFIGKYAWIFLPGFEAGYLFYSMIHYCMHTSRPPKFLKPLWDHHALHHYKYPELAFGVSSTFWDRIFDTMPPVKDLSKNKTALPVTK